ncbi:MAG: ParB/RepB/Spo0J family partition protein [Clostridia bacterium]|nr:ParB/RepB/Spo0J family partition protein [Clostridia bacterium]
MAVSKSNKGLGKGLGALLSTEGIPESTKDSVVELKLTDISPNVEQPRKKFEENALKELADSIAENGVIQPIIVQKKGTGYRIVAGERRWRASMLAGLKVIPAIVRELTDQQTMEQALIENIQRADLNPIEESMAMNNLLKVHNLTQEQLAKKLGKPRTTITNILRLINIDIALQDYVANGELSVGHAKLLLALDDSELQRRVANDIMNNDMSVRKAEEYIAKIKSGEAEGATKKTKNDTMSEQLKLSTRETETKLRKHLGSKVKIKLSDTTTGKGKLVIDYKNFDDLNRLIELIGE